MNKTIPATLAIVAATLCASASAGSETELAKKNGCTACHAVDKKVVGPAFQDIAKKYAGEADAVAKVSKSIRNGGAGQWGPVPMPPQPTLTDAEVKTLATWVLAGAK